MSWQSEINYGPIQRLTQEVVRLRKQLKQEIDAANVVISGLNKELTQIRAAHSEIQQQRGNEALSNRARLAEADDAFKALYKAKGELKRLYLGSESKRAKLREALKEADRYIHWYQDDLWGDDCVGDGKKTRSWNRTTGIIDAAIVADAAEDT